MAGQWGENWAQSFPPVLKTKANWGKQGVASESEHKKCVFQKAIPIIF